MLTRDGIAKILDFGLSKLARPSVDSEAPTGIFAEPSKGFTKPGTILGTVEYMSPEQAAGLPLDFRSDQFSMGSLMYEVFTGKRPFHRDTEVQTLSNIIEGEPKPVSDVNPTVPQTLVDVIRRCMRKDPRDRYSSTQEIVRELKELELDRRASGRRWTRRDWIRVSLVLGALAAVAGLIWFWMTLPYKPDPLALDWYKRGQTALHSMTFDAARKDFEQALAADPRFALAHASLAIAYDLLDYSDRAKDSMLRAMAAAQETRLSGPDLTRLRAFQCIVSREFDRAVPLLRQLESAADQRERPAAALEFGWLEEKRENTQGAAEAYARALSINPTYAAARLRMGFIQQRRGQNDQALKSFTEAESLYRAASDYEGVTETLYQRANFLIRRSRPTEAMPSIEKALSLARGVGNRYQEIRLQLLESAAARKLDQHAHAEKVAQQAIDAAVAEKMDNLATSGMIALGSAYQMVGDFASAEKNFRRALDIAHGGKVRKYEALASVALGSLFEQKNMPEDARRFIEAAVPFYRQAGYRREFVQCMILLGSVLRQLGELDLGLKTLREALPVAVQLQDLGTEVRLRERLVDILQDQGAWPEALQESERAASLPIPTDIAYARLSCSGLLWRLGRTKDAERSLSMVETSPKRLEDPQVLSLLRLRQAEIAYTEGRFEKAKAYARMAITAVPASGDETEPNAKIIDALASIRTASRGGGIESALQVVRELDKTKLVGKAASARLLIAEALASVSERTRAHELALEALPFFERHQIWESIFRGHMVAALTSRDSAEAEAHRDSARSALARLRNLWSSESVDLYLVRPDIKRLCGHMPL
jgi:tetratricopeptide (TPR) repeat protein